MIETPYRASTRHLELDEGFFDPVDAAHFPEHRLRYRNQSAARRVGLDHLTDDGWIAHFGRFEPLPGSLQRPVALRYHGHQFQSYNTDLGDGRGFLFAQVYDLEDNRLLDLGTKGSGRTPYSRFGDGRLTLKGGVREVLATEMLEALGVDTSKTFSLIETGEDLERGDEPSPTRSSVLVRLSHSHIRIGTFQRLSYFKDIDRVRQLVDYSVETYYPELVALSGPERVAAFLGRVVERVAKTGARWIAAGFVHGVLNTDNINITGESFDYGPWRFVPRYDPAFTAAYFDESGLYAFGRQPDALAWNLTRLAECLLPLGEHQALEVALNGFWAAFQRALRQAVLERLALEEDGATEDGRFLVTMFEALHETNVPYEQFFFDWRGGSLSTERAAASPVADVYGSKGFAPLRELILARRPSARHRLAHAYFRRRAPRTMLIEEMEAVWAPIAEDDDWSLFEGALREIAEMRDAYAGRGVGVS